MYVLYPRRPFLKIISCTCIIRNGILMLRCWYGSCNCGRRCKTRATGCLWFNWPSGMHSRTPKSSRFSSHKILPMLTLAVCFDEHIGHCWHFHLWWRNGVMCLGGEACHVFLESLTLNHWTCGRQTVATVCWLIPNAKHLSRMLSMNSRISKSKSKNGSSPST